MSTRSCTAVATLLTFWPPGPVAARKLSLSASSGIRISSVGIAPLAKIFGQRCGHVDVLLSVARNDDPRGVKKHSPPGNAVHPVADNAAAKRLTRVRAYLVCTSRHGTKFD